MISIKQNKYGLLLIVITLAGAALRLMALTTNSLWWDELQTMRTADPANSFAEINAIAAHSADPAPRSFYVLLNLWFHLADFNDLTARLLVALFGIASIPAMHYLGKELINRETGLLAAAITALNYYNVLYSLEVRFYPLLFFLSALSYLFFLRLLQAQTLKHIVLYVITTVLLVITHYFAILVLVAQLITWLFISRASLLKEKRRHLRLLTAFIAIALICLPFLDRLLHTLDTRSAGQAFTQGDYFFMDYFDAYFGWNSMTVFVALICFFLFLLAAFNNKLPETAPAQNRDEGFIILGWIVVPLVLAHLRTIMGTDTLAERYCIVIVPALIIAVACGLLSVKNTTLKAGLLILFLCGSFINTTLSKALYTKMTKDDFKGVVRTIKTTQAANPFYVYSDKNWHFKYYYSQMQLEPHYLDVADLTDGRFATGKTLPVEAVIQDTAIKDLWVASAHFTNLQAMKQLSSVINRSPMHLKIDSFISTDAFADHYIRKDWTKWATVYPYRHIISFDYSTWTLGPNKVIAEDGLATLMMLGGDVASPALKLNRGAYKLTLSCRGTMALDSFPNLNVFINEKKIGRLLCDRKYVTRDLNFTIGADSLSQLRLNVANDLYDPKTNADRNVYINLLVIKPAGN